LSVARIAVLLASTLLVGCATPYEKNGLLGGFDETQIAPNVWRVSFQGNGYTSSDRAEDLVLLRSAELTVQNGYSYFGLASSRLSASQMAYTTPVTTTTSASAYALGNTAYGTATSISYGGNTNFVSMPSAKNTVVMFKDRPDSASMIFDARLVCRTVGAKYKVTCKGGT
jgi:hypothetical protein